MSDYEEDLEHTDEMEVIRIAAEQQFSSDNDSITRNEINKN